MRPILCYSNYQEAERAMGALLAREIEAQLCEHSANEGGILSSVKVVESKVSEALKVIEDLELTTDAVFCPSCGSVNVEYPAAPQASPTMKLAGQVMDMLAGNKHEFICRNCNHVWS